MAAFANPATGVASNQYFSNMPSFASSSTTQSATPQALGQTGATSTGGQAVNSVYGSAPVANPIAASPVNNFNSTGSGSGVQSLGVNNPYGPSQGGATYGSRSIGHGIIATGLQYPGLSQDFANLLMGQLGQGLTPYGGSTALPTGGSTQPGQLTAGMNPLLQQLMSMYMGGNSSVPGSGALGTIASQGISALPEWQQMIAAQQQNIGMGAANLQEQFAGMGDLAGSPFGTAMSQYQQGITAQQNSMLGQLQQQNILQGQIPAAEFLNQGASGLASQLQNLNQSAITNNLQQYQYDQPQNNPMLQYIMAMSGMYPPTTKGQTASQTFDNIASGISSLSSAAGWGGSGGGGGSQIAKL